MILHFGPDLIGSAIRNVGGTPVADCDQRDDATRPVPGRVELVRAARVLREVAGYDGGLDPRRGALTAAQAGLLEACAGHLAELRPESPRLNLGT